MVSIRLELKINLCVLHEAAQEMIEDNLSGRPSL